jgi:hypothetical protein
VGVKMLASVFSPRWSNSRAGHGKLHVPMVGGRSPHGQWLLLNDGGFVKVVLIPLISLALAGASRSATLLVGDSMIPTGLGVGDSFQLAFVSGGLTQRGTGGVASTATISFWNSYVNTQADASTHVSHAAFIASMTWYAIASTTVVDANTNAVVSGRVYNINKALVASSYADMWDSTHSAAINYTQHGTTATGGGTNESTGVWTGTNTNGTKVTGAYSSLNENDAEAIKGNYTSTTAPWTYNATWRGGPTELARVYALSEVIVIIPEPATSLIGGVGGLLLLRRRRA